MPGRECFEEADMNGSHDLFLSYKLTNGPNQGSLSAVIEFEPGSIPPSPDSGHLLERIRTFGLSEDQALPDDVLARFVLFSNAKKLVLDQEISSC
jgi:hypothetical protein